MGIDGTYGFVYCGNRGLGVGVFSINGDRIEGATSQEAATRAPPFRMETATSCLMSKCWCRAESSGAGHCPAGLPAYASD
jgi:hypothetical protein